MEQLLWALPSSKMIGEPEKRGHDALKHLSPNPSSQEAVRRMLGNIVPWRAIAGSTFVDQRPL